MSTFHWCDNVHTTLFTPRDYQVELLAAAFERNTLVCLGHKSSKEFISLKLLQESAKKTAKPSIFLSSNSANSMHDMILHLTDLKVYQENEAIEDLPTGYAVYIIKPSTCLQALRAHKLQLQQVNLMILEDCHESHTFAEILPIFKEFYFAPFELMPKILSLGGPLHNAGCPLQELSAMINRLENEVKCQAETASDIVTVLRYCSRPIEYIAQCAPYYPDDLAAIMQDILGKCKTFLKSHRYDPLEIFGEQYEEEFKKIPNPKVAPLQYIDIMQQTLHEMGPWGAYRVAFNMYHTIEKQKIKTPYERNFLLFSLVGTALLNIQALCEQAFLKVKNHKLLVEQYSSPKVLRLLEILRLFKPQEYKPENESMQQVALELDKMDFQKLSRTIELSCLAMQQHGVSTTADCQSIQDNLLQVIKLTTETAAAAGNTATSNTKASLGSSNAMQTRGNMQQGRFKKRIFTRRRARDGYDAADNLCAIIFCNSSFTARALFELLVEMSRHDEELKFISCQFITDRVADPLLAPIEADAEHRKQEDVLKRFRMHDCNILIGTSILEEGIDVPKCNLVVRWDAPTTYRSYVQCKGRARATPAYHIILVADKYQAAADDDNELNVNLNDRSHRYICQLQEGEDDTLDESDSDDNDAQQLTSNHFTIGSVKGTVKILNPEVITSKPPLPVVEPQPETIIEELISTADESKSLCLTEIRDEEQFLNESTAGSCKQTKANANLASNDSASIILNNTIESNSFYEIVDLNGVISELQNSRQNSPRKQQVNKSSQPNVAKKVKKKRKFRCCLGACQATQPTPADELHAKIAQMQVATEEIVDELAQYRQVEKMLLQKCANVEPNELENRHADKFTDCLLPYKPLPNGAAFVDLSSAIALINKYCSKLPSDTFTKLTALWRCASTIRQGVTVYQYTLRLPINSPLKYDIVGLPMATHILARRMAALQACAELHKSGELDDNLQPIGKEGFKAIEPDWENFELEENDEKIVQENAEPRPGTTKRRQYYYKRIASELCNCRPTADQPCYLYFLDLTLQCPIPEEQNTRGRKIYPPEDAQQGFGILTLKKIPKVSSFPIFTRSGEVKVAIKLAKDTVLLTAAQIASINIFVNYTFTNVLRLQKFLMLFDKDSTDNCVFIVPTVKTAQGNKVIDWSFLSLIEQNAHMMPTAVPEHVRANTNFDANKFKDAVVMPWYRNQDQPQYFYVAEICPHLSPLSCFPGEHYKTFKHYYHLKYNLNIQNVRQPLLDVDHTSARLNFLTPRYVNRKGVALPTSSEETKRAKRENLEQKQILVPELCTVHPFPASLWRTAVCLPCILYRINGLLLADDIRKKVSADIGLGRQEIDDDFEWPMLDFGWSLSEVLKKSRESKNKIKLEEHDETNGKLHDMNAMHCNGLKTDALGEAWTAGKTEKSANEIIVEAEKKLQDKSFIEIGTWNNEMANGISEDNEFDEDEEDLKYLPPNISFCDQEVRYGSPTFWNFDDAAKKHKANNVGTFFDQSNNLPNANNVNAANANANAARKSSYSCYYDSDDSYASSLNEPYAAAYNSDEEEDNDPTFAFKSKNEAETLETEADIALHKKKLEIIEAAKANERIYQETKNLKRGYNFDDNRKDMQALIEDSVQTFRASTEQLKADINNSQMLLKCDEKMQLQRKQRDVVETIEEARISPTVGALLKMLPYANVSYLQVALEKRAALNLHDMEKLNEVFVRENPQEVFHILGCGDIFDNFNDKNNLVLKTAHCNQLQKLLKIDFQRSNMLTAPTVTNSNGNNNVIDCQQQQQQQQQKALPFSFDYQPDLQGHPGPSPSIILQALTMSNANDGINLERLETIGDSYLKYAITTYLYITYENVHEGKLSHLRSKQVANLNLYRLGRRKQLGEYMIATKFEPHDNWLPPCYYVPKMLEKELIEAKIPPHHWKLADLPNIKKLSSSEICDLVRQKAQQLGLYNDDNSSEQGISTDAVNEGSDFTCFIPYNLVTQHSIPDKSIADCVEALIGAYLIECGPRGALLFMAWLGIRVLPFKRINYDAAAARIPGSTKPDAENLITVYGAWSAPKSPLLHYMHNAQDELEHMLKGFDEFENILAYKFRDRSYLLQAMTHASYSPNRVTDCYQRLEFLGDAVLDYLITRHLYEDPRQHSPGALTDLRSALVNNTIFASLAVRHGFHKYFRHLSPGLNEVIDRFVRIQHENGHSISEEYYLLSEEECEDAEDVEVPKALGDVFESVAGAIFLDSGMSLDVVWRVYSNMMKPEIEQFSNSVPKSPIRELLELEPETAKFGKPEKLADGRRVRVTVEVFCKGTFRGIGRNYRIAKCTAAKCALRQLKKQGLITKKD